MRVSRPAASVPYPASPNAQPAWVGAAVAGVLAVQFCLLALIAWRILAPDIGAGAQVAAARKQLGTEREVLDRIIGKIDIAPEGVTDLIEKQQQDNESLRATNLGLLTRVRTLQKQSDDAAKQYKTLEKQARELEQTVKELKEKNAALETELAAFRKTPKGKAGAEGPATWGARLWAWRWYWGIGLLVLALIGITAAFGWINQMDDSHTDADADPRVGDENPGETD